MRQLITPIPDIPCKPGWCLAYVNETFGVPKKYGRAIDSWNASKFQHTDKNFPDNVWFPLWFELDGIPAGHVALMAPDKSVYSTSDLTIIPHHHPNLDDLMNYYSYYGVPLTYLGWTEDVEDTKVIDTLTIVTQSTETDDDMSFTDTDRANLEKIVRQGDMQIAMLTNIANSINASKGDDTEVRDNVRKIVWNGAKQQ